METSKNPTYLALQKQLRLWPGIVIVIIQWLVRFILPVVLPNAVIYSMFGGIIFGLAIVVWWAFFSRAPRAERWSAIILMLIGLAVASQFLYPAEANNAGCDNHYRFRFLGVASLKRNGWGNTSFFCMEMVKN